jgi:hypothetical protein
MDVTYELAGVYACVPSAPLLAQRPLEMGSNMDFLPHLQVKDDIKIT